MVDSREIYKDPHYWENMTRLNDNSRTEDGERIYTVKYGEKNNEEALVMKMRKSIYEGVKSGKYYVPEYSRLELFLEDFETNEVVPMYKDGKCY